MSEQPNDTEIDIEGLLSGETTVDQLPEQHLDLVIDALIVATRQHTLGRVDRSGSTVEDKQSLIDELLQYTDPKNIKAVKRLRESGLHPDGGIAA